MAAGMKTTMERRSSFAASSSWRVSGVLLALGIGVLAGCAGTTRSAPPAPTPEPVVEPEPEPAPRLPTVEEDTPGGGDACDEFTACASGAMCRGPAGCQSDWSCGEPRACGEERVAYCGCDGVSFYGMANCPARPYRHTGACDAEGPSLAAGEYGIPDYDERPTSQDRVCSTNADCRSGEVCFGSPGCGVNWRCQRVRGCASAQENFCGCDGETFRARGQCPGRPYVHRGACGGDGTAVAAAPSTASPAARPATGTPARPAGTVGAATPTTSTLPPAPVGARTCTSSRDCASGELCIGPEGCGMTWTCARPTQRCNPDTQVFCDCERNTFRASMTCPGRPFAHRGSCEMDRLLELSGAAIR